MKSGAALSIPALVCTLSGFAFAGDNHKACLEGDKKACVELGTVVANDEPPAGDDACAELEEPADPDPAKRKISTSGEIAAKIRKLERQAAAGPAK